ncbi:MAG TPA: hypothetical protein VFT34_18170 [Verrucomicrobiae bacterium]|nr:hypothetical protein [Verrucomicrobiae bacterium]
MKTGYLLLVSVLCGVLAGLLPAASRAADEGVPVAKNKESALPPPAATATVEPNAEAKTSRLSAGLDDIVKLTKAGIEEPVILSFIKCSEVAYQPTAQELIKLRELGVSGTVVTALLHRGEELRQRAAQPQKQQAQPAPAAEAPQAAPQVASPPEPSRVYYASPAAYSVASPSVVYVPSYSYSYYPSYGYGGCYSPSYYGGYYGGYYPSFSVGFGFGGGRYYGGYGGYRGSYHVGSYGGYHGGYRHCR